jgi:hypothetical protein
MFPDGYVICYTNPNNTIRLGLFNPEGIAEFNELVEHIKTSGIWKDGGEIK